MEFRFRQIHRAEYRTELFNRRRFYVCERWSWLSGTLDGNKQLLIWRFYCLLELIIKHYLRHISSKYGIALSVLVVVYLGIWVWAIGFSSSDLKLQFIFGFFIISLLVAIPPLFIFYDSFEKRKDASLIIFCSFFVSYYAIVWYLVRRKNLKDIDFGKKT